jgi:hypothetical protein
MLNYPTIGLKSPYVWLSWWLLNFGVTVTLCSLVPLPIFISFIALNCSIVLIISDQEWYQLLIPLTGWLTGNMLTLMLETGIVKSSIISSVVLAGSLWYLLIDQLANRYVAARKSSSDHTQLEVQLLSLTLLISFIQINHYFMMLKYLAFAVYLLSSFLLHVRLQTMWLYIPSDKSARWIATQKFFCLILCMLHSYLLL